MKNLKRGVLITFEGIDGSGKTTLAGNLSTLFEQEGLNVMLTKEPGGTPLGADIRNIVQYQTTGLNSLTELFLFAADRAQHIAEKVKPALIDKKLVFSDRMADSTRAYQGYGRGIDQAFLETIINRAVQGVKPDIVFYLALDIDTAWKRLMQRPESLTRFEKQDRAFYEAIIKGFNTLFAQRSDVVFLDAQESPQALTEKSYAYILEWLSIQGLL